MRFATHDAGYCQPTGRVGILEKLRPGGHAWVDDANFDPGARELASQRVRQADDGVLGRGIHRRIGRGSKTYDRGDVDDHAATALEHPRQHALGRVDDALQVRGDELVDLFLWHFVQRAAPADAGVVDEDVEALVIALRGRDEGP